MVHYISRAICRFIFKVFFQLEISGRENIPKSGGFILASNHVSFLDPLAVGAAASRKLNYMARHDLFCNPLFGWYLYKLGVFPLKRDTGDIWSLKEAMKRVKNGGGLLLFPEGRRLSIGEQAVKAEAGIGFLADKLDVPVIPVHVRGTENAWPRGVKFPVPAKVSVTFGRHVSFGKSMPYQDIAQAIMDDVRNLS